MPASLQRRDQRGIVPQLPLRTDAKEKHVSVQEQSVP